MVLLTTNMVPQQSSTPQSTHRSSDLYKTRKSSRFSIKEHVNQFVVQSQKQPCLASHQTRFSMTYSHMWQSIFITICIMNNHALTPSTLGDTSSICNYLDHYEFQSKLFPWRLVIRCLGQFLHLTPTAGCQLLALISQRGVLFNIFNNKIPNAKVLNFQCNGNHKGGHHILSSLP